MIQRVKCKLHKLPYKNHGISKTDLCFTESNLSIKRVQFFLGYAWHCESTRQSFQAKYLEYAGDPWITDFAELRPLMEALPEWRIFFFEIPGGFGGEAIWVFGLVKYVNLC